MESEFDTIVVGAGFAGLTAARELSRAGQRVLIVEARERVGGRTWLEERLGMDLELGGTWVHWTQPYVWAELHRYGIGLAPSPEPQKAYWWDGQQTREAEPDVLLDLLDRPNRLLTGESRAVFPQPFAPLTSALLQDLDDETVQSRIDALDLTEEERTLLTSFWTLNVNGKLTDAAYTQALRWIALTNGDWRVCFEACATYKIAGGTKALARAMQLDSGADVLLGAEVTTIVAEAAAHRVTLSTGAEYTAANVILAVPLSTIPRIRFSPSLPKRVTTAAERGQAGLGTKVWATIEGEHPAFVAFGAADWPLNFVQAEYVRDGKTYLIGFGPDASVLCPEDTPGVRAAVQRLVPWAEVTASSGHDWVGDDLSRETWPMHRPGYLTRSLPALRADLGGIQLAGSDYADGWGGFIDGAIESGLTAARRVLDRAADSASVNTSASAAVAV